MQIIVMSFMSLSVALSIVQVLLDLVASASVVVGRVSSYFAYIRHVVFRKLTKVESRFTFVLMVGECNDAFHIVIQV